MSKQWIVDVLHTVDHSFFERVIDSIEDKKKEIKPAKVEEEFDVDEEMLDLVNEYNRDRTFTPNKKVFSQALQPRKKRNRKDQKKQWEYLDAMEARIQRKELLESKNQQPGSKRKFKL